MNLLREASSHDVIRANPIPGRVNTEYPTLATCSRNSLCEVRNDIIRTLNAEFRDMVSLAARVQTAQMSLLARATALSGYHRQVIEEWDARVEYWIQQNIKKDVSAHNAEVEYREEVIEALMAEGKSRHVAADMTNTPAKLQAQAKRLGV